MFQRREKNSNFKREWKTKEKLRERETGEERERKREKLIKNLVLRTPGMAPPGTDFIMVYMPSPPELDESGDVVRRRTQRRERDIIKRQTIDMSQLVLFLLLSYIPCCNNPIVVELM